MVSIHATLAGGDCNINRKRINAFWFLSTPPSRVATLRAYLIPSALRRFYPRHPRGWRHMVGRHAAGFFLRFYPRHPRGWRLGYWVCAGGLKVVSIHATLAGGDAAFSEGRKRCNEFLSTPPSRVATAVQLLDVVADAFLSTPPSRVATDVHVRVSISTPSFYPRHPRGWRPFSAAPAIDRSRVSIHATLAGGDWLTSTGIATILRGFYPRHPRGWRLFWRDDSGWLWQ